MSFLPTGSRLLAETLDAIVSHRDPSGSCGESEEARDRLLTDVRQALVDGAISCEVVSDWGQRAVVEPSAWIDDLTWGEAQSPLAMTIRALGGSLVHGRITVLDREVAQFMRPIDVNDAAFCSHQARNEIFSQTGDQFADLDRHLSPFIRYIALAARELKPTKEIGIKKIDFMYWLSRNWHKSGLPTRYNNTTTLEMMAMVLCWPEHRTAQRSPEEKAYRRELGLDQRPAKWKPPGDAPNRSADKQRHRRRS